MTFPVHSPLDLRHLKMLLALHQTGSISKAAQRLHVTQSAVSHQLKGLETHYGIQLLERSAHPLRLTAAGEVLLALAQTVSGLVLNAENSLRHMHLGAGGVLRIAVECHTCFDWLMPAMDQFRMRWPEVELDIVSGFHTDPLGLLYQDKAEFAVVSEWLPIEEPLIHFSPLFEFDIVALVQNTHALAKKNCLLAEDFIDQTLITYPVPDEMIDVVRTVLKPAGVKPHRRTSELTIAILQLVASGRGIAALPLWAVKSYVDKHYVKQLPITPQGLRGRLYGACKRTAWNALYIQDFVQIMRDSVLSSTYGVTLLLD